MKITKKNLQDLIEKELRIILENETDEQRAQRLASEYEAEEKDPDKRRRMEKVEELSRQARDTLLEIHRVSLQLSDFDNHLRAAVKEINNIDKLIRKWRNGEWDPDFPRSKPMK